MTTTTAAQQRFSTFAYNLIIIIFIIGLLALIWFTYGRQVLSTEPPIPSQVTVIEPAPLPVAVNAADVLFQESFDVDTSSSWDMSIAGQAEIARGVMVLDDNQYDGIAFAQPHLVFDNFVAQVHTRWLSGSFGGRYGLQFRVQDSLDGDYYAFYIRNDGRYVIGKYLVGRWYPIHEEFSEAILRGGGVNLLRVEAEGSTLRFFVNDTYLTDVVNEGLGAGDVRLAAERATGDTTSFAVAFDNLVISQHRGGIGG